MFDYRPPDDATAALSCREPRSYGSSADPRCQGVGWSSDVMALARSPRGTRSTSPAGWCDHIGRAGRRGVVSGSPGAVMPNCRHGGGPRGGGRDQGDLPAGHATDGETDAGRCGLPGGVGHEPGVGIAGRMVRVVGDGRGGTAYDERISDHAPAGKTFTGRGKSPLQFGPAQRDTRYRRSCGLEV